MNYQETEAKSIQTLYEDLGKVLEHVKRLDAQQADNGYPASSEARSYLDGKIQTLTGIRATLVNDYGVNPH